VDPEGVERRLAAIQLMPLLDPDSAREFGDNLHKAGLEE
jgi:hypothetical protein